MRAAIRSGFCVVLAALAPAQAEAAGRTLGFAIDKLQIAIFQTADAKECPAGFQAANTDNFNTLYKTPEEQAAQIAKTGHVQNRGASGENIWAFPQSAKDPLPFHEVQSRVAFGRNLDGTTDGAATANTCKHEKFTDPDGVKGVDNQLYRAVGCIAVLRNSGLFVDFMNGELKNRVDGRVLMEISGVDDEMNDPDVTVSFYKGRDELAQDAGENTVPWQSQTVDERYPHYITRAQGSIANGVVRTQPVALRIPHNKLNNPGEFRLRDMRLELKISGTRIEGLVTGYHDLEDWYKNHRKPSMVLEGISGQSGPALYEALHRLADGHKDPQTQQCTSLSSAHQIRGTRAFLVHRTAETRPIDAAVPETAQSMGAAPRAGQ